MSRTYRKFGYKGNIYEDIIWPYHKNSRYNPKVNWDEVEKAVEYRMYGGSYFSTSVRITYKKDSKTGRKLHARARSDGTVWGFKEPGPSWFRRIFSQRPYRRRASRELQKYMKFNGEYEPMIESKPALDYWT